MDKWREKITHYEQQVARHRNVLVHHYGEDIGNRLFDEFHKWYERKSAAWTRCHELVQQHNTFQIRISSLEWKSKHGGLLEYQVQKLRDMRVKSEEAIRVAERIRTDLLPLNRAVVQSCFKGMPPPPKPAASKCSGWCCASP